MHSITFQRTSTTWKPLILQHVTAVLHFSTSSSYYLLSRHSSDSIVTMLWVVWWGSLGSIPSMGKRFFSSQQHPDWLWGHLASYLMGTGGSFPDSKAAGAWCWWLTSVQCRGVKILWSYTIILPYIFMAWYLIKHRERFAFIYLLFLYISFFMLSFCVSLFFLPHSPLIHFFSCS
jgi:hypothetical protein